ncbi:hypothetical protein B0H15DRAFT_819915 [Mycena belliarum]|uniref:Uncharacterized protein n=1 Tax=Mycena belliarum TaxID=1033014 RepID=A0AAD6XTU4_9AGAR|nr:hypothetical protein B0H15DRAFT_819915 [Mycena belliae]
MAEVPATFSQPFSRRNDLSSPRLRHTGPRIQSSTTETTNSTETTMHLHFEDISSRSINPRGRPETDLQHEVNDENQTLLHGTCRGDQSIGHQQPLPRENTIPPSVPPEHPYFPLSIAAHTQHWTENAGLPNGPELARNEALPRQSALERDVPVEDFFRPDPATDRAAAKAGDCRRMARTMLERLEPCEPFLNVSQSTDSCRALERIFASMGATLQPSQSRHDCAPPGVCAHEAWHARHTSKLGELAHRFEHFIVDFDKDPPSPRSTSDLATKLARHVDEFQRLQSGLQRSWIRLGFAVADMALQQSSNAMLAAELDLAALRLANTNLRIRRESLRGELRATRVAL